MVLSILKTVINCAYLQVDIFLSQDIMGIKNELTILGYIEVILFYVLVKIFLFKFQTTFFYLLSFL